MQGFGSPHFANLFCGHMSRGLLSIRKIRTASTKVCFVTSIRPQDQLDARFKMLGHYTTQVRQQAYCKQLVDNIGVLVLCMLASGAIYVGLKRYPAAVSLVGRIALLQHWKSADMCLIAPIHHSRIVSAHRAQGLKE